MKKLTSVIFILFLIYGTASPQSCLEEGITFTTQEQIDNFQTNYPGCTEIEGDVKINGSYITNLYGLNVLTAIWGDLLIDGNDALTSLTGLENITSIVGSLFIGKYTSGNASLTSLTGLDNVTSIGGALYIWQNAALTSLTGLDNVTSIGGAYLWISHNGALTSLSGLNNVTSIGGWFELRSNDALTSLSGLDNVTSIGGFLWIGTNGALTNLTALDNVTSIGGNLTISGNGALTSLLGLDNVTSIGEDLWIEYNPSLTSLTGLDKVASIGGRLIISNSPALTSLSGLNNIDAASINSLSIHDNIFLSTCEVQSICDYLSSPNGTIAIHDNASGCNSQEEVEEACEVSVESINPEDEIFIFPNPANRQLTISSKEGTAIEEVIIYNQIGQIVQQEKQVNNIIDISQLQPGMYIIEIVSGQRRIREKLMVE